MSAVTIPKRLASLPVDPRGFVVPYHQWVDAETGEPDFRVIDAKKRERCAQERRCGLCGRRLGWWAWVVGGPLTMANRITSEGPFHEDCLRYAVAVCPFLVTPTARYGKMERTAKAHPGSTFVEMDSVVPERPSELLLAKVHSWRIERDSTGSPLLRFDPPATVETVS